MVLAGRRTNFFITGRDVELPNVRFPLSNKNLSMSLAGDALEDTRSRAGVSGGRCLTLPGVASSLDYGRKRVGSDEALSAEVTVSGYDNEYTDLA